MSKNDVLIAVVLDKSGSMLMTQEATIRGFNEFVADQQEATPDAKFSLTLFDTLYENRYVAEAITNVKRLTSKNYRPAGWTALYDAIGRTVSEIEALAVKPAKIVFAIVTDGAENSSTEFTHSKVFELIRKYTNEGWQFTFIGANQDSYAVGGGMGIQLNAIYNFNQTPGGTVAAMGGLSNATRGYTTGSTPTLEYDEETRERVENTV